MLKKAEQGSLLGRNQLWVDCLASLHISGKTLHVQVFLGSLQVLLGSHPSHQDRRAGILQVRGTNFVLIPRAVLSVALCERDRQTLSLDGGL